MPNKKKRIWVISGTHWDREWRYSADQSLLRLAEIVDDLFDILEQNKAFTCFHLDGGTIVIEDYLAVRPQNEARLRELIKQGRIAMVPWYTLPEMNTVAPEALIRNLLIGTRLAQAFGAQTTVGYTATSYGQISQLPQIYQGFGLKSALTYRGTNKHQVPPICLWEGADGTRIHHIRCFDEVTRTNWFFFVHYELVLGKQPRDLRIKYDRAHLPVHMADETMCETGFQVLKEDFSFRDDPDLMRAALGRFLAQAEPQAIGEHILGLDMEDNASPYTNLPKLITRLNEVQNEYELVLASLDNYVAAAVGAVQGKTIAVLKGELRYGAIEPGFNALLGTTQSSRTQLKLLNNTAERELIAVAEPLSALSAMVGGKYWHSLLDRAWRELLKCHAHDSICGAAIDEAHQDMPQRFRAVMALARETAREACEHIWSKLNTAASFAADDLTLTFFNTLPRARRGVIPVIVDTPVPDTGEVYREACSGAGPIEEGSQARKVVSYDYFDLVDDQGREVPWHLVENEKINIEVERPLDSNAIVYNVVRNRLSVEVDVPPLGYRTYAVRPRDRKFITHPQPGGDRPLIAGPDAVLENEYLKVQINPNGTFDLTDKVSGRGLRGLHYFADAGSVGNAHQHRTPLRDFTVTSLGSAATITLMANSVLSATWRVEVSIRIPAAADLDMRNRSTEMVDLPITSWLTLHKGSRRLEIKTRFENRARDHRLQVMLPTDVQTNHVYVEGAFDVIERCLQHKVTAENMEAHYPFQPMQGFVDLTDGKHGLALMTKGLREYEMADDKRRTLALTLMRAHRAYMRANKGLMTPEEYERNTGQHSFGLHETEYAIMLHRGDWREGGVALEAQDFNTPWRIIQGVPKPGELPVTCALITITPSEHVHLSALYQDQEGRGYILRVWNSADRELTAAIQIATKIIPTSKVSMDQTRVLQRIEKKGKNWEVPLRAKEIATLYLEEANR